MNTIDRPALTGRLEKGGSIAVEELRDDAHVGGTVEVAFIGKLDVVLYRPRYNQHDGTTPWLHIYTVASGSLQLVTLYKGPFADLFGSETTLLQRMAMRALEKECA